MPGMRGTELATRLRMMRPGVRVLFMSAYAPEVEQGETLKDVTLLQKPFSAEALTREVRTVLDR
jgi:two-component system cell cycle sensor histidine kinase/response regulator CckA